MKTAIPNPAWETAQYTVHFLVGIPVPAVVRKWNRKRRRKWMRQRKVSTKWPFMPDPVLQDFDEELWASELSWHRARSQ